MGVLNDFFENLGLPEVQWNDFDDFIEHQNIAGSPIMTFHEMGTLTMTPGVVNHLQGVFQALLKLWSGANIFSRPVSGSPGSFYSEIISDPSSPISGAPPQSHIDVAFLTSGSALNEQMKNGVSFLDIADSIFLYNKEKDDREKRNNGIGSWFMQCLALTQQSIESNRKKIEDSVHPIIKELTENNPGDDFLTSLSSTTRATSIKA